MQLRQATLPSDYEPKLRAALLKRGYSLDEPGRLAEAVLRLSNFYLENPSVQTPWEETWAQVASLVYFFPLNYSRCLLVAREAGRFGYFKGLASIVDDGAGMGSAIHSLYDYLASSSLTSETPSTLAVTSWLARDVSHEALSLLNELNVTGHSIKTEIVGGISRERNREKQNSLLIASYVFTELKDIPKEWLDYDALIIIEPSTRDDARRLQGERKTLLDAGFHLWAPCTHAGDCPLLISNNDWCHDRVHFVAPAWYSAIEKTLPMKNRTLTFSYLVARKTPSPLAARVSQPGRLVGDTLNEKGKSRQALCRSSEKEFLAWFPQRFKTKTEIEMSRGSLVRLGPGLERKSQEVRFKDPDDIYEFGTDERID
jgi:hypothetical protein